MYPLYATNYCSFEKLCTHACCGYCLSYSTRMYMSIYLLCIFCLFLSACIFQRIDYLYVCFVEMRGNKKGTKMKVKESTFFLFDFQIEEKKKKFLLPIWDKAALFTKFLILNNRMFVFQWTTFDLFSNRTC
jgi:hypothetical protein